MHDYLEMRARGATVEEFLRVFRENGLSKIESTKALIDLGLVGNLRDAKPLVHFSETWADRREQDDEFHRKLIDSVRDVDGMRLIEE